MPLGVPTRIDASVSSVSASGCDGIPLAAPPATMKYGEDDSDAARPFGDIPRRVSAPTVTIPSRLGQYSAPRSFDVGYFLPLLCGCGALTTNANGGGDKRGASVCDPAGVRGIYCRKRCVPWRPTQGLTKMDRRRQRGAMGSTQSATKTTKTAEMTEMTQPVAGTLEMTGAPPLL